MPPESGAQAQNHFWYNVLSAGAIGDGRTLNTRALQAAIDACHARGGGTVFVPAGKYLTGSFSFRDNITLHLDPGAVLLGSQNPADYLVTLNRWEGTEQSTYSPLLSGNNLKNIALAGRGTIDGQGETWWEGFRAKKLAYPRPRLIGFADCSNVLIEGVTLVNSPSWTVNPVRCENVNIRSLTIINPPDSPNTDGINPDSCRQVHISDCFVSAGDDCIALKSGVEREQAGPRAPCRDVTITNCTLARGHGGVVIGSEMSGGVQNVVVSNCIFIGTDRGIRLKSRRGRGGIVQDIRVSNLVMTDVLCPLTVNLYYNSGARGDPVVSDKNPRPVDGSTPSFRHIHLNHITARNVKFAAGFLYGLAEMPLEDITLGDVSISLDDQANAGYPEMADGIDLMQQAGFHVRNARRLLLERVEITGQRGPAIQVADSSLVEISASGSPTPCNGEPVVRLSNVRDAIIRNCRAVEGTDTFLELGGAGTRDITLIGNALAQASRPVRSCAEVPAGEVKSA
jgi:polygalacturonase